MPELIWIAIPWSVAAILAILLTLAILELRAERRKTITVNYSVRLPIATADTTGADLRRFRETVRDAARPGNVRGSRGGWGWP